MGLINSIHAWVSDKFDGADRQSLWTKISGGTVQLINDVGTLIGVQHPMPTNGDSVYVKDVWVEASNMFNFSGSVTDLFDDLHTVISDETANNPKELLIHFNRTTPFMAIGLGAFTGNFSNIKVIGLTTGNTSMVLYDESSDNTKLTSKTILLPATGLNAIKLEFHTSDSVSLSNLFILKASATVARIQGQKPNGDFVEFQATNSGNFKSSIEEFENSVSTNNNTQLNVSPYILDEDGDYSHVLGDTIFKGAQIVISPEHHEIHCGDSYECTDSVDLPNNGVRNILIVVPDHPEVGQLQKLYHFKDIIEVHSECTLTLFEGATVTASGTAIPSFNRNRNSILSDTLGIFHTPTITDDGNAIWGPWVLGDGRSVGNERGRDSEFVLKNNTTYLLRIENNTTATTHVNVELDYYVHPGV